jgi:hypothetical protein
MRSSCTYGRSCARRLRRRSGHPTARHRHHEVRGAGDGPGSRMTLRCRGRSPASNLHGLARRHRCTRLGSSRDGRRWHRLDAPHNARGDVGQRRRGGRQRDRGINADRGRRDLDRRGGNCGFDAGPNDRGADRDVSCRGGRRRGRLGDVDTHGPEPRLHSFCQRRSGERRHCDDGCEQEESTLHQSAWSLRRRPGTKDSQQDLYERNRSPWVAA